MTFFFILIELQQDKHFMLRDKTVLEENGQSKGSP